MSPRRLRLTAIERLVLGCLTFQGLAVAAASRAAAEPSAAERAIAESLYERGQAQMKDGNVAAACDSFAESLHIDPGPGILLNLASCHETAGKLASAWVEFREAAASLRREPRGDRLRFASDHLAAIEPRLAYVTMDVDGTLAPRIASLALDGLQLGRAAWGVAIPVDAGAHEVVGHYRGGAEWKTSFRIQDGERRMLSVPVTPPAPSNEAIDTAASKTRRPPELGAVGVQTSPALVTSESDTSGRTKSSARRPIALGLGAAGLVAIGVGGYLGLHAAGLWGDRNRHCPMDVCTPEGLALGARADSFATASTWSIAGGAVAVAGAAFLLFVPQPATRSHRTLARALSSVRVDAGGRVGIGGAF